jgi:hypothetical protein
MFSLKPSVNKRGGEILFKKMQAIIEGKKLRGFSQLLLFTEIQVYKGEKIGINESGLTTPIVIKNIPGNFKGSITIDTQYIISSHPELEYEITLSSNE